MGTFRTYPNKPKSNHNLQRVARASSACVVSSQSFWTVESAGSPKADVLLGVAMARRTVAPEATIGRRFYEIGNGQWNIPKLRTALEAIVSGHTTIESFEVEHAFPIIGRRVMVLNAHMVYRPGNNTQQILLAIEDVTERVGLDRAHALAHERIGMLMQELIHRVKNSLQSISAMVMIEAHSHKSDEGKAALERVSHRIDALGHLCSRLSNSNSAEAVDAATCLNDLCSDLVASIQSGGTAIAVTTDIDSALLPTDRVIPIGLEAGGLRLTVADDGKRVDPQRADSGLGSRLVAGFAQQLGGQLERESGSHGTTVRLILPPALDAFIR